MTLASELGAIILAGGQSKRLEAKCFRMLGGKELVLHVFERIREVTSDVTVVTKITKDAKRLSSILPGTRIILDPMHTKTPLAALLAGFRATNSTYVFAAPCDMPFISGNVIRLLYEHSRGKDAAIPTDGVNLEPLCAVYRRSAVIYATESVLKDQNASIIRMISGLQSVVRVPKEELRRVDPTLLTFLNINTDEEMKIAHQILHTQKTGQEGT